MATTDAEYIHQKKGPRILGVFWAFYSVSAVMVSLRLCIRARMLKNIGLDDYIIVAAIPKSHHESQPVPPNMVMDIDRLRVHGIDHLHHCPLYHV